MAAGMACRKEWQPPEDQGWPFGPFCILSWRVCGGTSGTLGHRWEGTAPRASPQTWANGGFGGPEQKPTERFVGRAVGSSSPQPRGKPGCDNRMLPVGNAREDLPAASEARVFNGKKLLSTSPPYPFTDILG